MSETKVIPTQFLRSNTDISNLPVIHTWQSIVWHQPLITPKSPSTSSVKYRIKQQTTAVQPKPIGTFVTSQSKVTAHNSGQLMCTMQSSALVLGIDPEAVISFDAGIPRLTQRVKGSSKARRLQGKSPSFQWTYTTSRSQALLYRMASGDSNHIHVDTSASEMLGIDKKAPLLHGLFTLALVYRAIVKLFDSPAGSIFLNGCDKESEYDLFFRKLEGAFKKPAFVGDSLCVKIWVDDEMPAISKTNGDAKKFLFIVTNHNTGAILIDNGAAEVEVIKKLSSKL